MLWFEWSAEKNDWLQRERKVSFEQVVDAIQNGRLIEVVENTSRQHKGQRCFIVLIHDYPHVVPFVERGEMIFLKTVYPSSRHKK